MIVAVSGMNPRPGLAGSSKKGNQSIGSRIPVIVLPFNVSPNSK
jgi:hypothetical protein